MKKIMIFILALSAIIFTASDICAARKPLTADTIISKDNSYVVTGKILKIQKSKGYKKIYIICNEDYGKQYDGHIYSIKLSDGEFQNWKEEQGKIKKNTKVTLLNYDCYTKTLKDDVVVNIRKDWY